MKTPLRESDYLKAWAAFALCATTGGFIAGFFAGVMIGVIFKIAGMPEENVKLWAAVAGFFAGLPVSYACFRFFVARMIVERIANQEPPPV